MHHRIISQDIGYIWLADGLGGGSVGGVRSVRAHQGQHTEHRCVRPLQLTTQDWLGNGRRLAHLCLCAWIWRFVNYSFFVVRFRHSNLYNDILRLFYDYATKKIRATVINQ